MSSHRSKFVICITAVIAFAAVAGSAYAQQPIFVIQEAGWANSGIQSTPPAALIVGTGACIQGPNCNVSITEMSTLNPLMFYPSSHVQTVTITSAWGTTFDAYASVFAQGGNINWSVAEVLSNDGLVPANFFQSNQANGGTVNRKPATVTSVQVILAPFTFQQTSGGWWVAIGSNGIAPQMTIRVYGTY
jgi:hypothetical protein